MAATVWLTKIILSHLITDFILQPKSWVDERTARHFSSPKLYVHGFITALLAFILTGFSYLWVAIIIMVTHVLIDGWKSYQKQSTIYFIADQCLHLAVILVCWYSIFIPWRDVATLWQQLNTNASAWKIITAFVFLTTPAGIIIGQLTRQWRNKIYGAESLANAGKWIGILERIIILIFVLFNQYAAIGLLVAAKGIIRFNEKDRQEIKTEYLVIGTLMSMAFAIITGLIAKM